jgi:hypothetical protein
VLSENNLEIFLLIKSGNGIGCNYYTRAVFFNPIIFCFLNEKLLHGNLTRKNVTHFSGQITAR